MSEKPTRPANSGMDELASWLGLDSAKGEATDGTNDMFATAFGPREGSKIVITGNASGVRNVAPTPEEAVDIREGFTTQRPEGLPELDPVTQAVINARQGDAAALETLNPEDQELAKILISIADDHGIEISTMYGAISDPTKNLSPYPVEPTPPADQPPQTN